MLIGRGGLNAKYYNQTNAMEDPRLKQTKCMH